MFFISSLDVRGMSQEYSMQERILLRWS